jgi:hypothetical protein
MKQNHNDTFVVERVLNTRASKISHCVLLQRHGTYMVGHSGEEHFDAHEEVLRATRR